MAVLRSRSDGSRHRPGETSRGAQMDNARRMTNICEDIKLLRRWCWCLMMEMFRLICIKVRVETKMWKLIQVSFQNLSTLFQTFLIWQFIKFISSANFHVLSKLQDFKQSKLSSLAMGKLVGEERIIFSFYKQMLYFIIGNYYTLSFHKLLLPCYYLNNYWKW